MIMFIVYMEVINMQEQAKEKKMKRLSNFTIHFGKFKGQKFSDLVGDRDYTIWLHKQDEFLSKNDALREYIEYTLTRANE